MYFVFISIGAAITAYVIWNAVVFGMYASDKRRAKNGERRISEQTLLLSAALMGGLGALLGMHILRHKTKHFHFVVGVPVCLLLNILAAGIIIYLLFVPKPVGAAEVAAISYLFV